MLPRPDTRFFLDARIDAAAVRQIVATFAAALPNETGACLTVAIRDTTLPNVPYPLLTARVTRAHEAAIARATPFRVWFDHREHRNGCESSRQFAMAHSHPYTVEPFPCTHSNEDSLFLTSDPRLLFSIIFCGDGRGEVLWQDTRRRPFEWFPVDTAGTP